MTCDSCRYFKRGFCSFKRREVMDEDTCRHYRSRVD